jgi:TonB family protein
MSWAHYLLQVNIYLIIFYGFYKLLLDKETYFVLNRIYLIISALSSFIIPFLRFEWFNKQDVSKHVYVGVDQLNSLISQIVVSQNDAQTFNWGNLIVAIYILGVMFFFAKLIFQLLAIKKIVNNKDSGQAFSFFRKKIVSSNLPEVNTIDVHENIHIKQLHSLDVIFFEIVGILTWFNPIIYFYKSTIKNIHEYLADEVAAKFKGDKEAYTMLLLSQAFGINPNHLANGFLNKSTIKKRVFMLHKQKSTKIAVLKYGLFVPLFALTLVLSSATIRQNKKLLNVAAKIPLNKVDDLLNKTIDSSLSIVDLLPPKPPLNEVNRGKKHLNDKKISNINSLGFTKNVQNQSKQIKETSVIGYETKQEALEDKIYNFVSLSTQPTYPGGQNEFYKFIGTNIKYPKEALAKEIQGKVYVSFVVEKNGELSEFKIDRSLGGGTDEEAIRVLKMSPNWNPAILDGQTVRVKYNLPIQFTLKEGKKLPVKVQETSLLIKDIPENKAPLYVIDGKIKDLASLKAMDVKNIESIKVLKGQLAIASYGERAQNGVLLISSKN